MYIIFKFCSLSARQAEHGNENYSVLLELLANLDYWMTHRLACVVEFSTAPYALGYMVVYQTYQCPNHYIGYSQAHHHHVAICESGLVMDSILAGFFYMYYHSRWWQNRTWVMVSFQWSLLYPRCCGDSHTRCHLSGEGFYTLYFWYKIISGGVGAFASLFFFRKQRLASIHWLYLAAYLGGVCLLASVLVSLVLQLQAGFYTAIELYTDLFFLHWLSS